MKPAFLVWLAATRKVANRIRNQYQSNIPKGIV